MAAFLVLASAYAARSAVARLRHPAAIAAPALPPLAVVAASAPDTDYELIALDASLGHLLALAAPRQPRCPPVAPCPAPPTLDRFVVLDGATMQPLTNVPLATGGGFTAGSTFLLADATRHLAYIVTPHAVAIFSAASGALTGGYMLPIGASDPRPEGAVLDPTHQRLLLLDGGELLALDAVSGRVLARRTLAASSVTLDSLALDPVANVLYALRRAAGTAGATLLAFDAMTLIPVGPLALPEDAVLGPVNPSSGALALFGAGGRTYQVSLVSGQPALASAGPAGALALGWNTALGHMYVAHATDVEVADDTGVARAALPLRVAGGTTLLNDPARSLLYLPADGGAILVVQDNAADGRTAALTPGAALLLARAALPQYLPDTNQDPPFLDALTFWPCAGTRSLDLWIHFANRGWTGPYAGVARSEVVPSPAQAGGFRATFTLTWMQIFQRSHTWTLDVAPDGAVAFVGDSGDVVP
jgi:hypothetical protein